MQHPKPLPLMLEGKPHYTLSSYDPVDIDVYVPYITDSQVQSTLELMVRQEGGTMASLDDPAWVQAHFGPRQSRLSLLERARQALQSSVDEDVHLQALQQAEQKLAERLQQSVPHEYVDAQSQDLLDEVTAEFRRESMDLQQTLDSMGATKDDLVEFFHEKAQDMAECDAALMAFATARHIRMEPDQMASYLGLDDAEWEQAQRQMRAEGTLGTLMEQASLDKARNVVLHEAHVTYHHQTRAEAQALEASGQQEPHIPFDPPGSMAPHEASRGAQKGKDDSSGHPNLRLV